MKTKCADLLQNYSSDQQIRYVRIIIRVKNKPRNNSSFNLGRGVSLLPVHHRVMVKHLKRIFFTAIGAISEYILSNECPHAHQNESSALLSDIKFGSHTEPVKLQESSCSLRMLYNQALPMTYCAFKNMNLSKLCFIPCSSTLENSYSHGSLVFQKPWQQVYINFRYVGFLLENIYILAL